MSDAAEVEGRSMGAVKTSRRVFLRRAAVAVTGLIIPGWLPRPAEAAFQIGDVPSRVSLNDISGSRVVVPSDFVKKVVLIHFWASWCPVCRGEMQALESLYVKQGGEGFTPCSIGLGEKRETAVSYLKNMTVSYPVLLDPALSTKKPFGVAGIPTTFVLDRGSVIRYKILGKVEPVGLEKMVRSLL